MDERRRPEDFLELVERAKRGRLKVYIGFAAGVGKTYRMLEEAHALHERGVDVVLGFVETHGRAETEALLAGLEIVPRRKVEYRGLAVEEMDLDAVLARRPQVALVDEVAHTNVPGCRNTKRYQDVLELLDAGINVICAFNVQHLESLKDIVERATGARIRETVPDTFLKQADQVVNLDLAVEDLLERLRAGKIYAEDKVDRALDTSSGRRTSRRCASWRCARWPRASSAAPSDSRAPCAARAAATRQRVMVCIASSLAARAGAAAARLAPGGPPQHRLVLRLRRDARRGAGAHRRRGAAPPAREHRDGAGRSAPRWCGCRARDAVAALLDFARSHGVGHIVVGRSREPLW